jgi:hypothetical protein
MDLRYAKLCNVEYCNARPYAAFLAAGNWSLEPVQSSHASLSEKTRPDAECGGGHLPSVSVPRAVSRVSRAERRLHFLQAHSCNLSIASVLTAISNTEHGSRDMQHFTSPHAGHYSSCRGIAMYCDGSRQL